MQIGVSKIIALKDIELNDGQIEGLPKNPRFIRDAKFQKLKKSIEDNPEMLSLRELLVFPLEGKYVLIGGNMRYRALKDLHFTEAPCKLIPADATVEQLKAYTIKDNAGFGEWDFDALANDWDSDILGDWGVDLPIGDIGNEAVEETVEDDFDESKDDVEGMCKKGDIWQLGEHRLMCGDSTSDTDFALLMNNQTADIAFTSPPYNLMKGFKTSNKQKKSYLKGKGAYNEYSDDRSDEDYANFLTKVLKNCIDVSDDVFFNIGYTAGALKGTALFLGQNADYFAGAITWRKSNAFMPQYQVQFGMLGNVTEPVYLFNRTATRKTHHPQWKKGEAVYNVIETKNASNNEYASEHAATFPVEFASEFIRLFTKDNVLDCFGGSGTTMIAAEQLNRKCFMMELDAHYCDIIIARWEKFTGKVAVRLTNINETNDEQS